MIPVSFVVPQQSCKVMGLTRLDYNPSVNVTRWLLLQGRLCSLCVDGYRFGLIETCIHLEMKGNSYTMVCPPLGGDNPQALASSYLPYRRTNHGITIL